MNNIPSISIPLTIDHPTCQSACQCCNLGSREGLSSRLSVINNTYKAERIPWWERLCKCCYKPPNDSTRQSAILQYREHIYALYGQQLVHQAESVSGVNLNDKLEYREPLTVREILLLETTIKNLQAYHLKYIKKREQVDEVRDQLDAPASPRKHRKNKSTL